MIKKYRSKSGTFLGLTVLFLSVSNIQHMLIDINYFSETSIIRGLYIPWQWLVAPMFFLFAYYFLNKKKIKKRYMSYLFIPFFIIAIIHGLQLFYHIHIDKKHVITKYYERGLFLYTNLLSFIHIPSVIYLMYKMILQYEEQYINKNTLEKIKEETSWLKYLIHIGIAIVTLGMISAILVILFNPKESYYAYPFFISLSLWIYWVGYVGINRSSSYAKLEKLNTPSNSHKIGFTTFNKINHDIIEEKEYLHHDISLNIIAEKFEISSGYLSQLINTHTNKSFNDYINELRVESSKKMLLDQRYNNYTIESIGLKCGFKSKSNFYTAFKKFTDQTPNQYKKLKSKF